MVDSRIFFDGWTTILRVIVVGVLSYVALVGLIQVSGKRTLAKMNAFDFVVTVALGSTLATILLSKDVSLAAGITALGVLIGLQYLVAWSSVRVAAVQRLVKSEPRLLACSGQLLRNAMLAERVSEDEVLAAIRSQGHANLSEADAVILETDGSFSVLVSAAKPPVLPLEKVEEDGRLQR